MMSNLMLLVYVGRGAKMLFPEFAAETKKIQLSVRQTLVAY